MAKRLKDCSNASGILRRGYHATQSLPVEVVVAPPGRNDRFDLQLKLIDHTEGSIAAGRNSQGLPATVDLKSEAVSRLVDAMLSAVTIDFDLARRLIDVIASRTTISSEQAFALVTEICTTISKTQKK